MSDSEKLSSPAAARALGGRSPLRDLIDKWRRAVEREVNDRWCNTEDAPMWRSIHRQRAAVFSACADDLEAVIGTLPNHENHEAEVARVDTPGTPNDSLTASQNQLMVDAAEMLWVVLANVSGGDWTKQTPEWQEAAARWRDNYFAAVKQPAVGEPVIAARPHPATYLCSICGFMHEAAGGIVPPRSETEK